MNKTTKSENDFEFRWRRPTAGFQWVATHPSGRCEPDASGFLVARMPEEAEQAEHAEQYQDAMDANWKIYQPDTALFKNFVDTETSPAAMLEFANCYGSLWGDVGESRVAWIYQIELMRHAVRVWEAIKLNNSKLLAEFIHWHDPQKRSFDFRSPAFSTGEPAWQWTFSVPSPTPAFDFKSRDSILAAKLSLHTMINQQLDLWTVKVTIVWKIPQFEPALRYVPTSLIAALWFQFARAIVNNHRHLRCAQCKKWFQVSGKRSEGAQREGARFCSSRGCKFKAYRGRQKEAQRLSAAGVGVTEIASRLASNTETIKEWITKGSSSRPPARRGRPKK